MPTIEGHVITADLRTRRIAPLGAGEPIGGLDGIEPDGQDG